MHPYQPLNSPDNTIADIADSPLIFNERDYCRRCVSVVCLFSYDPNTIGALLR